MDKTAEQLVIDQLQQTLGSPLQGIILYGSQARGDARPDSDIDLGVLVDGTVAADRLWDIAQALASQVGSDVDLVDLRPASTVLQKEIIAHGQWLWQGDAFACQLFEVHVISMYQELQYNRKDIIDDIQRRLNHG